MATGSSRPPFCDARFMICGRRRGPATGCTTYDTRQDAGPHHRPAFLLVVGRTAGLIATFVIVRCWRQLLTLRDRHLPRLLSSVRDVLRTRAAGHGGEPLLLRAAAPQRAGPVRCECGVDVDGVGTARASPCCGLRSDRIANHSHNRTAALPPAAGSFLTLMLVTTVFEI
jgi:hypothetical protein